MTKKTKFGWALCLAMCLSAMPASYASDDDCIQCRDPDVIMNFNANGGTGSTKAYGWSGHTIGEALGKLPKAKRTGYAFKGWYTKKSGGKTVSKKTKLKKNVTYYAHWKANKYSIKLKTYGKGTVSGGGKKAYKSKITLKAKPASGYVFDGWYLKGVLKSKDRSWTIKVPLNGATYTAKFVAKKNF